MEALFLFSFFYDDVVFLTWKSLGGEAAHEAVVVEVRGPLLQLRPLVLYHLLPVWAAGLES